MKYWLKAVFVIALLVIGLAACASLGEGRETREIGADGGGTAVSKTRIPTIATPIKPTLVHTTPSPTPLPIASSTFPAVYLPTWMFELEPTPTPLNLPDFVWANNIQTITTADSYSLVWSPTTNEFVFDYCPENSSFFVDLAVFTAHAPDFKPVNISPPEFVCTYYSKFIWRPDGKKILFNALPIQSKFVESSYMWVTSLYLMDRSGNSIDDLGKMVGDPIITGWIDNTTVVYFDYGGGSPLIVDMLDVNTGDILAWDHIHAGIAYGLTEDYVIMNSGAGTDSWYSAEVFSREAVREEDESSGRSLYSRSLSINYDAKPHYELLFNSRYETTLPDTNQIMVLTWDADAVLDDNVLTGSTDTDLQLWDLDTNELDLIIPGGIYGRYSPNGHYLAYLTPAEHYPQIHLLDQKIGATLFNLSAYARSNIFDIKNFLDAFVTFSPNGRFLTFFNPAHDLIIYDLENGEFWAPLTAVPTTPLWSPDSGRFVYQDPEMGLSIFDTSSAAAYPLAVSGSNRLLEPQWSYDGAYLSVTVKQEEWWGKETAVLQIP